MLGYIDNIEFVELEVMKYYAPPANWNKEKKQEQVKSRIFSGDWVGAEKKDGYFARFIKDEDGNCFLQSRSRGVSGEFPNKYEWVPHLHSFFKSLPNGTCLLGELYLPDKPGSSNITKILGCKKEKAIERQKEDKLHFYIFDCLAFNGKNLLGAPASERFKKVSELDNNYEYVGKATYYDGKELWTTLQNLLASDAEGMVILNKNGKYEPNKRSNKTSYKVKKELQETIDCFFTGAFTAPTREYTGGFVDSWRHWENLQTKEKLEGEYYKEYFNGAPLEPVTKPYFNGWAGSLEIGLVKEDKVVPIGLLSGLTDEIKSAPEAYKGRVIEVTAMELNMTDHTMRHARMLQFRSDKNWKDCKWEDVFEK